MTSEREFDVIVYGATGFVGKYATAYLGEHSLTTRWAVAGRSRAKLQHLVHRLKQKHPTLHPPTILVADALGPPEKLCAAFRRARLVLNLAGPFSRLGRPVVSAAVASGAHYVDVTGEPIHILRTELDLHAEAAAKGLLVVPACGFDHVPADIGCAFTAGVLRERARRKGMREPMMDIEMFMRLCRPTCGYCMGTGTLDSIMQVVKTFGAAWRTERRILARYGVRPIRYYGDKFGVGMGREPRLGGRRPVICPNDGETFAVRRTLQRVDAGLGPEGLLGSDSVAFKAYIVLGSWWALFQLVISIIVCLFVAYCPGGERMILRYPGMFTWGLFCAKGPTEEQVAKTSSECTFIGRARTAEGKSEAHVVVMSKLPEPTYVATSRIAIAAAFTILHEREKLPKGGVLTPGMAFFGAGAELRKRLADMGAMNFEVVSE